MIGSSAADEPDVERPLAAVFADEYEVERAGVSKNGSLGARGRLVWVVEAIGGCL